MSGRSRQWRHGSAFQVLVASAQLLLLMGFSCELKSENVVFASDVQIPKALKTRVLEYWQARIKNDLDKSYELESPQLKGKFDRENYKAQFGHYAVNEKIEVTDVTTQGDGMEVKLKVHYRLNAPIPGVEGKQQYAWVKDHWKQVEGRWYHVQKDWMP